MPQTQLNQFFGAVREGLGDASAVCSRDHDDSSDDDAPMVIERRATGASAGFSRSSDGRVLVTAKRSRYEGEAEECSYVEFVSSESDSFVVDDHSSGSSISSSDDVPALQQLHDICASLRNRRNCVQCPQCLRLMRAIADFLTVLNEAVR